MDVITIESQAYKELVSKINTIAKFVIEHQSPETKNPDDEWVDSYEVCTFLKISERTLQRLRSNGIISYSILSGKTYYTIGEIRRRMWNDLQKGNNEKNRAGKFENSAQCRFIKKAGKSVVVVRCDNRCKCTKQRATACSFSCVVLPKLSLLFVVVRKITKCVTGRYERKKPDKIGLQ